MSGSEQDNSQTTAGGDARTDADAMGDAAVRSSDELTLLLEDARGKADEHWNMYLRANAELDNTRKRAQRDVETARKFALERFAQDLLPVMDGLQMGLAASGDQVGCAKLREGMVLTERMLSGVLERFGIKAIDPVDQPFNPTMHQAVSVVAAVDKAPNTVISVMQKGYVLNERLIRPAMVVVSKPTASEDNPGSNIDAQA